MCWIDSQSKKKNTFEIFNSWNNLYLFLYISLSKSRRHLANTDAIADVKSKFIVSRRHFFADVISADVIYYTT